jgi:hypothetical protein
MAIVSAEKQYALHMLCVCVCVCVYVCSLSYPACKALAPYCHPWPVWFCHIFPYYVINDTILEKRSLQLLPETVLVLGRIQRECMINVRRTLCKVSFILVRF